MKYQIFETAGFRIAVAGDDAGLRHIDFQDGERPLDIDPNWQEATNPDIEAARLQLTSYFAGERRDFDLPLAPEGTAFQQAVWQALTEIPFGQTISYSELAQRLQQPKASRAVGAANGRNPLSVVIPCHRVIGKSGKLTGYAGGLAVKARLLEIEAI